jgi:hypothetical protein
MKEKRYFVNEDYPSETWESILGLTAECAETILSEEEFKEWRKDRDAQERAYAERVAEYSRTHYFPGCYGDPLTDC